MGGKKFVIADNFNLAHPLISSVIDGHTKTFQVRRVAMESVACVS